MRRPLKLLIQNERSIRYSSRADVKTLKTYLKPRDIPREKAAKILSKLNSFDSAEQLEKGIQGHTQQMILTAGDTQRILHARKQLGKFQELRQVSTIYRIGAKKFDFIVRALSNN